MSNTDLMFHPGIYNRLCAGFVVVAVLFLVVFFFFFAQDGLSPEKCENLSTGKSASQIKNVFLSTEVTIRV